MTRTAAAFGLVVAAGCVRLPRGAGFDDVQRSVSRRTSAQIAWRQGTADEAALNERVEALLASELTPESAVQIALYNSPSIQATYERLGVAPADLLQAGPPPNPAPPP